MIPFTTTNMPTVGAVVGLGVGLLAAAVLGLALLGLLAVVITRIVMRAGKEERGSDDRTISIPRAPPSRPPGRLVGWLDDRMNPIVVKELRQAVRSRFILSVLMLLLAIQVIVLLIFVMYDSDLDRQGGMRVFSTLFALLTGVSLLLVAGYAGVRFSSELSGQNVDLMFITTLRPRSIVLGKVAAAAVLALVMYSTCMPFMSFTYLLRGIDLPTIFTSLGCSFTGVLLAICLATFLGSIRGGVMTKLVLAGLFLVALGVLSTLIGMPLSMSYFSSGWDYWAAVGSVQALQVLGMGLFVVLATAMIMPPVANRALPVRVCLTVLWLLTGALAMLWVWKSGDRYPMDIWATVWLLVLWVALPIAVSERDRLPVRVRTAIPRNRLARVPLFVFYSGSGAGVLWCVLMGAGTMLALAPVEWGTTSSIPSPWSSSMDPVAWYVAVATCYIFTAAIAAGLTIRLAAGERARKYSWVGTAIVVGLLAMLPIIVYGGEYSRWGLLRYASPVHVFMNARVSDDSMLMFAVAGMALLAYVPLLVRQAMNFSPPPQGEFVPPADGPTGCAAGGPVELAASSSAPPAPAEAVENG